jgi:hypothetical protein
MPRAYIVESRKAALILSDQLRVKAGLAITRNRQLDLPGIGDDGLLAITVSPIAWLLAGQMMVHLGVQNPFGQCLLQVVDQPVRVEGGLGVSTRQQLIEHGIRYARFLASRHCRAPLLRSCPTSARNS